MHVDWTGRGRVVDEEDAGHHVLCPHGAGDCMMGDEVLHILLKLRGHSDFCISNNNNAAVTVLMIKIDDLKTLALLCVTLLWIMYTG